MAYRRKRKSRKRKTAQQKRFAKAAKACKGKPLRSFRACVRRKLKKKRRRR